MQQKVEKWLHYVECSHFLPSAAQAGWGAQSWSVDILITIRVMGNGGLLHWPCRMRQSRQEKHFFY